MFFVIDGLTLTGQQGGLVNLRLKVTTYLRGSDVEHLQPMTAAMKAQPTPARTEGNSHGPSVLVRKASRSCTQRSGLARVLLILAILQLPKFFGTSSPAPVAPPPTVAAQPRRHRLGDVRAPALQPLQRRIRMKRSSCRVRRRSIRRCTRS